MDNVQSYSIFPTLIIRVPGFISEVKSLSIFEKLKSQDRRENNSILGGKSSYGIDTSILEFLGLYNSVQKAVDEYTEKVSSISVNVSQSWFNIQDVGSILKQHNHPYSIISGALYINVNSKSSNLCFQNPNELACANLSGQLNPSEYNSEVFCIEPKIGDLIIFPSWLKHGSMYEMNSTPDRTVVSFNTCIS